MSGPSLAALPGASRQATVVLSRDRSAGAGALASAALHLAALGGLLWSASASLPAPAQPDAVEMVLEAAAEPEPEAVASPAEPAPEPVLGPLPPEPAPPPLVVALAPPLATPVEPTPPQPVAETPPPPEPPPPDLAPPPDPALPEPAIISLPPPPPPAPVAPRPSVARTAPAPRPVARPAVTTASAEVPAAPSAAPVEAPRPPAPPPGLSQRYLNAISGELDRRFRSTVRADRWRGSTALVRVRLRRDGEVLEAHLARSSGDPEFDAAVLGIHRRPLPPFDADYPGAEREFTKLYSVVVTR